MSRLVLASGFAMFSMFFGSGNLVFPLLLGTQSKESYLFALLGLILTGVIVPFLGLVAIILYGGQHKAFFARLGNTITFLVTLLIMALIGPLGIIPRCMVVGFGGLEVMGVSKSFFPLFSGIFASLLGLFVWKKAKVVDVIAYVLTPFKFGSIIFLTVFGLLKGGVLPLSDFSTSYFASGVEKGYQMMDLLASFFFSGTIYDYLKNKKTNATEKELFSLAFKSSLVGGGLIGFFYVCFVLIGSKYSSLLANVAPEQMLPVIAQETLGKIGLPIVAFTLIVSCLATSTVTLSLCSDFVNKDILRGRASYTLCVLGVVGLAYALAQIGFMKIYYLLGSVLEYVYPFLIVFTLFQIFIKIVKRNKVLK
jgi:LIVCS family branched-chain amino acid:cation transporter